MGIKRQVQRQCVDQSSVQALPVLVQHHVVGIPAVTKWESKGRMRVARYDKTYDCTACNL